MPSGPRRWFPALLATLGVWPAAVITAALIEPPWCGTQQADAAADLPDGSLAGDPVRSFGPNQRIECAGTAIRPAIDGLIRKDRVSRAARSPAPRRAETAPR